MRTLKISTVLVTVIAAAAISGFAQQEFTVTKDKTFSSTIPLDAPGLTGNSLAIVMVTPVAGTESTNPHPIGVVYKAGKWHIFNSDNWAMPAGAKYNVQFFPQAGPNQFLHLVTQQNLGTEGSYIDNPALNNRPGAQLKILQSSAPGMGTHGYGTNAYEARAAYSPTAGKWYIANINGSKLTSSIAYNIIVSSATDGTNTNTNPNGQILVPPMPRSGNTGIDPRATTATNTITPFGKATPTTRTTVSPGPTQPTPVPSPPILNGFVDMHTHPMSHLGFGKKLLHGAPDIGMVIPAGTRNCNPFDLRASSIDQALGNGSSTHGGWGTTNICGDFVRAAVINNLFDKDFAYRLSGNIHGDHRHEGVDSSPEFLYAPHQTSKVHQQMWWEWIKRAKEFGDLRVMVALTVNNELLANILNGDNPKDDKASADLQIDEIITFVDRHSKGPDAWMEIAYTPADLRRIVGENKLAVVLGMEVDNIGNFNKPGVVANETTVKNEINRLYRRGVRYIFPIHLLDNKFGGTAVYSNLFNAANKYSTGSFFSVKTGSVSFKLGVSPAVGGDYSVMQSFAPTLDAMSGIPYGPAMQGDPTKPGFCPVPILGCWQTFKTIRSIFTPDPSYLIYSTIPGGHVNTRGLSDLGKFAVLEMMKLGMIIDIDHMSDKSQADTLDIAERLGNDYPVSIGHNGLQNIRSSERIALLNTVKRVAALKGVFGVGTADSEDHKYDANTFISSFNEVWSAMGGNSYGAVAIGTDVNGMERLPRAPASVLPNFYNSAFPKSRTGNREWDYPSEGVTHYGLIADFLKDVKEKDPAVHQNLMNSTEHFARMWEKVERRKTSVK